MAIASRGLTLAVACGAAMGCATATIARAGRPVGADTERRLPRLRPGGARLPAPRASQLPGRRLRPPDTVTESRVFRAPTEVDVGRYTRLLMTSRHLARLVLTLSALAASFGTIARASSPGNLATVPAPQVTSVEAPSLVGAPVLNNNQPVLTSGPTVTLSWTAPVAGVPMSYVIEASSTPGGPVDLANFNTGNAQTTMVVPGVPFGTYYVRVRGLDASGLGPASNEIQLSVGAVALSAPVLNNNQPVLTSGPTVTLSWTAPVTGLPISYIIEASSTPGGPANLANFNTGTAQTSQVVANVPAGTYHVRVRGLDASGPGAPSNEVQLVVSTGGGGVCPSAPRGLNIVSQGGGAVTLAWQPPLTGVATSYVVQAGSVPGAVNLANFDTNSTALSLAATVPAGSYFVRVYARSSACASPTFLGPASNEILLSVGGVPGWGGQIECRIAITGPSGYRHDETQTWFVGPPAQVISNARTDYHVVWSAQGSGGGVGTSWTIGSTATTDLSVTRVASTGIPIFDRTTTPILIRQGIVGAPASFDLHEIDFQTIVAPSGNATSVTGTWSRPTVGGDSPQQPGGSVGTLSCTWSLRFQ